MSSDKTTSKPKKVPPRKSAPTEKKKSQAKSPSAKKNVKKADASSLLSGASSLMPKAVAQQTSPTNQKAPAKKKSIFAGMAEDALTAGQGINERSLLAVAKAEEEKLLRTMALSEIQPRQDNDTRPLKVSHLVSLAESISSLGLIEPIVVDQSGILLAGGHRFAALRLLSTEPKQRVEKLEELCPGTKVSEEQKELLASLAKEASLQVLEQVPVRMLPFNAAEAKDRALAVEIAENTQRRDYTSHEIFEIFKRLLDAGYTDREGRPKEGEKQAKPALAAIIGKSLRTVRRLLNEQETPEDEKTLRAKDFQEAAKRYLKASESLRKTLEKLEETKAVSSLEELLKSSKIARKIEEVEKSLSTTTASKEN